MLVKCSKDEIDQYLDFMYGLALDLAKSGYPTYRDGIKDKAAFVQRLYRAFEREDEEVLLFVYDGEVQGLILYYWISEDRYLQTSVFCTNVGTRVALEEFVGFLKPRFRGYELFMGFPAENKEAVGYLSEHGFECIEDDYNNTAFLDRCDYGPAGEGIVQVGRDNYAAFRTIHDQVEGDMYWDSDHIFEKLDDWILLVKEEDGLPKGVAYYRTFDNEHYELFGIDTDGNAYDPKLFGELLTAVVSDCKKRGGKALTFFSEKEYEENVIACGFTCIGNYLCYKICLE